MRAELFARGASLPREQEVGLGDLDTEGGTVGFAWVGVDMK